jgi:ubiquinone/menaquinone biosynthesis C-methylase UbiE
MFVDPVTQEPLKGGDNGCLHGTKQYYPLAESAHILDFVNERSSITPAIQNEAIQAARVEYDRDGSIERYENFLSWLFQTLEIDESAFRQDLVKRLSLYPGDRLLITSCGLGEEIGCIQEGLLKKLEVHLQDISKKLVLEAFRRNKSNLANLTFSVSDAMQLPYPDCYFDKVLHFGGINLFEDMGKAIQEMNRVCKVDGRIVFGDEGISPNLIGTDLYKALVFNNPLWSAQAPVDKLPSTAKGIRVDYVLNNCFWIIEFTKSNDCQA